MQNDAQFGIYFIKMPNALIKFSALPEHRNNNRNRRFGTLQCALLPSNRSIQTVSFSSQCAMVPNNLSTLIESSSVFKEAATSIPIRM